MSRQSLLPCAWLSIAFGLAVVAAPNAAWSQDRPTQERLDRLERDLNMLQRQVYRGAPPPAGSGGGAAVDSEIRMDRLESQRRDLTGRVEEFINQIEQIRQRVEQVSGDVDTRFGQTTAAVGPPAPANPAPARPSSASLRRVRPGSSRRRRRAPPTRICHRRAMRWAPCREHPSRPARRWHRRVGRTQTVRRRSLVR